MTLGDKLRSLRAVEGSLRGLGRPMTQLELHRAMKKEVGRGLSQAYLSQIESGSRPHLTQATRELLARFFRVYPGFLVDDPDGYSLGLQSDLRATDAKVDRWLYGGVDQFPTDPDLSDALLTIAEVPGFASGAFAPGRDSARSWSCRAAQRSLAACARSEQHASAAHTFTPQLTARFRVSNLGLRIQPITLPRESALEVFYDVV